MSSNKIRVHSQINDGLDYKEVYLVISHNNLDQNTCISIKVEDKQVEAVFTPEPPKLTLIPELTVIEPSAKRTEKEYTTYEFILGRSDKYQKYPDIIADIAKKHFMSKAIDFTFLGDLPLQFDLIDYMKSHKPIVKELFKKIGFYYPTCVPYNSFDEILSIIEGVPYVHGGNPEDDSDTKEIIVKYYDNKYLSAYATMWCDGKKRKVEFNRDTNEVIFSDLPSLKCTFVCKTQRQSNGYINEIYQYSLSSLHELSRSKND